MGLAFLARLLYWWILVGSAPNISGDANFYYQTSHSIADNLQYELNGKPTAIKLPGYPLFAGVILRLFKKDIYVLISQYLLGILASLPIFFILKNYLDENKVLAVIFAYLFYPTTWHWESQFMSETLFIFLNSWFLFFMHTYLGEKKLKKLFMASIFGAISLLTRPAAIFPLGVFYFYLLIRENPQSAFKVAALSGLVFLIIFSPWVVRNYRAFGHFIPISTSGGITIYTSYVNWGYDMSIINLLPEDSKKLAGMENEYEKDKFLVDKTVHFLKQYPLKILTLAPMKLKDYLHPFDGRWYPLRYGSKYNVFYGVLLSLAALSLFWNWNKKLCIVKLSILYILGSVVAVLIFHGEIRYRFVLNPLLFILAGLCFVNPISLKKMKVISAIIIANLVVWGIGATIP
jgi:hypothetical protein